MYTIVTFSEYIRDTILRATALSLSWNNTAANGDYQSIIDETLYKLGVNSLSEVTDNHILRKTAAVYTWKAVMSETAADYNIREAGASLDRQIIYQNAEKQYHTALRDYKNAIGIDFYESSNTTSSTRSVRFVTVI